MIRSGCSHASHEDIPRDGSGLPVLATRMRERPWLHVRAIRVILGHLKDRVMVRAPSLVHALQVVGRLIAAVAGIGHNVETDGDLVLDGASVVRIGALIVLVALDSDVARGALGNLLWGAFCSKVSVSTTSNIMP